MRKPWPVSSRRLNRTLLSFWTGLAVLSGGCMTEHGASSFEMLEPIATPPSKSGAKGDVAATDIVINPIPPSVVGNLAKPIYPPGALAGHAGECVVYVTLTIDSKGMVSDVTPSWQRVNIPNRFSEQFIGAIRTAVRSWRFEPARDIYWEQDRGGDLKYLNTETHSAQTDIKFTFEASGKVL
jgi:hypothetical protein